MTTDRWLFRCVRVYRLQDGVALLQQKYAKTQQLCLFFDFLILQFMGDKKNLQQNVGETKRIDMYKNKVLGE